jgi:hypothetical protein
MGESDELFDTVTIHSHNFYDFTALRDDIKNCFANLLANFDRKYSKCSSS